MELDFLSAVSLESILQDLQALDRGMELTRREFSLDAGNLVLKAFLDNNTELLNSVMADGKTAQVQLSMLTADHMIRFFFCIFFFIKLEPLSL